MPTYDPPPPIISGLRCRCPRCGQGKLFAGFLTVAKECDQCGLDLSFADPADGPAFFVMSGVGIVVIGLFAWAEVAWHPPIWVHLLTTFPALIIGCLASLRPVKAWLVASQYFHKAEEARFSSLGGHGEGGFGLRGRARD
ncbi:DUF983 domain-containing protein [Phenylobacterium sp.]|uniref:DUF983 domain-containing protein n=1 Tax=Phenylobacterium sp. TaxID=1871053 RepID=UPI00286D3B42|nr:DUF983 domain-containing protein [Phenylobacterium sp.]